MAFTRFGDAGPVFGLIEETTGFAQAFNQKTGFEEALADDQVGNTVTAGYFNQLDSGQLVLIAKDGATLPQVMTAAAIDNLQDFTKAILMERDRVPEQKGYEKHTFQYKVWASLAASL